MINNNNNSDNNDHDFNVNNNDINYYMLIEMITMTSTLVNYTLLGVEHLYTLGNE